MRQTKSFEKSGISYLKSTDHTKETPETQFIRNVTGRGSIKKGPAPTKSFLLRMQVGRKLSLLYESLEIEVYPDDDIYVSQAKQSSTEQRREEPVYLQSRPIAIPESRRSQPRCSEECVRDESPTKTPAMAGHQKYFSQ